MKKNAIWIVSVVAVIALIAGPAFARKNGYSRPAGRSHIGHLFLYEKVPSEVVWEEGDCAGEMMPWEIVERGAWGKMTYTLSGDTFDFIFNGHGLPAGVEYTLIYYPDDWDFAQAGNIICLASGTSNPGGNIHIGGSIDVGTSLPVEGDLGDCNYDNQGAKIWLVLSADLDLEDCVFVNWDPAGYLFEGDVISFEYIPSDE